MKQIQNKQKYWLKSRPDYAFQNLFEQESAKSKSLRRLSKTKEFGKETSSPAPRLRNLWNIEGL